jgi:hypothetical protein
MSIPGILSGITMVFVPCISTFYISYEFSNGMIKMIGDVIEDKFYKSSEVNYNMGATISLVLMVLMLQMLGIPVNLGDTFFGITGKYLYLITWILFNIAMVLYDFFIVVMVRYYIEKLRPRFRNLLK